jgi:hypothetical protein
MRMTERWAAPEEAATGATAAPTVELLHAQQASPGSAHEEGISWLMGLLESL